MKKILAWTGFALLFSWMSCMVFVMWASFLADLSGGLDPSSWVMAPMVPVTTVGFFGVMHLLANTIREQM